MKKSTAALTTLITVAGITGTTTLTAQAHPARMENRIVTSHTSTVAVTRLHELLHAPSTAISERVIRPDDGGSPAH
jgi:hypothetical protein